MKRLLSIAILLMGIIAAISLPATVHAYSPFGDACGLKGQNSSICSTNGKDPLTGSNGVIRKASNLIATIAAVTAIIIIMIGGLQYVVSRGDSQKLNNARMAIIGGAVGLGIIAAAQGILLLVLSRLQ